MSQFLSELNALFATFVIPFLAAFVILDITFVELADEESLLALPPAARDESSGAESPISSAVIGAIPLAFSAFSSAVFWLVVPL